MILLGDSGQALAEVADDFVTASTRPAAGPELAWREIEVELAGGDTGLLAAADGLLTKGGLRRSERSAKLERVLAAGLPAASPGPKLTPATPAGQVIISYLAGQADRLQTLDPLVRRSEPDAVHQMRVTTRRLRSTFRAYPKVLGHGRADQVAAELKWLGEVLGGARDVEVMQAHLQRHLDETDVALLLGPVSARIQSHFAAARASAQAAVSAALTSSRYAALLDELDALLAAPPAGPDAAVPARAALPRAVRRSYTRTRRRIRRVGEARRPGRRCRVAPGAQISQADPLRRRGGRPGPGPAGAPVRPAG